MYDSASEASVHLTDPYNPAGIREPLALLR